MNCRLQAQLFCCVWPCLEFKQLRQRTARYPRVSPPLQKPRKQLLRLKHRPRLRLKKMVFLFILRKAIMMIPAALTGIMTVDPMKRIREIMITRIVPEIVLQMVPGMVLQTRILPVTKMVLTAVILLIAMTVLIAVILLILQIVPVTRIRLITRMSPRIPQGMTPLKISPTRILPLLIRVRHKLLVYVRQGILILIRIPPGGVLSTDWPAFSLLQIRSAG